MQFNEVTPDNLKNFIGKEITLNAYVQKIQKASGLSFVSLRYARYIFQAVYIPELCRDSLSQLCEGAYVEAFATVTEEKRSEYGFELTLKSFRVLSRPTEDYPISVSQPTLSCTLEEKLINRAVSVKHPNERAVLAIKSAISFAYSEFMQRRGFIGVNSPKVVPSLSDSEYIRVKYFDKEATLSKTPVPYMIIAAGGLDMVYEVGAGYSSKHGNSIRHLNEFTRLDFELAYASAEDAQSILSDVIAYITNYVLQNCKYELEALNIALSAITKIPSITHNSAMELLKKPETQQDLDPTDERKLCEFAKDEYNSDYIFITQIPSSNRPFYEKDMSGFSLLSSGIEIASGGERISDYDEQANRLAKSGLNPKDYEWFLSAHKNALPPISGAGIGLERLVMSLLKLKNIRDAAYITRDLHHLLP